jgi:hypothetical protein
MSSIPPKLYEEVHRLMLGIANASEAGDEVLAESLSESLRELHRNAESNGSAHPFLTEAVADLTDDPQEAALLYQQALNQSRAFPDEPTHTKMISLAEQLLALGRREQAEALLRDGCAEASRRADTYWAEYAERLLKALNH